MRLRTGLGLPVAYVLAVACSDGGIGDTPWQPPGAQEIEKPVVIATVNQDGERVETVVPEDAVPAGAEVVREASNDDVATLPVDNSVAPADAADTSATDTADTSATDTTDTPATDTTDTDPGLTLEDVVAQDPGAPPAASSVGSSLLDDPAFASASLAAFETTVYPVLQTNCSRCHSSDAADVAPLHSDVDVATAHEAALTKVSLRTVENSRLISRLGVDAHNCWDDCASDAAVMESAITEWANAVQDLLPEYTLEQYEGALDEATVLSWIAADRANIPAEDQEFVKYTSLHLLQNFGASFEDLNAARVGISKTLNSLARVAPEIVNPQPIDKYGLVYRFDIRDYWGYQLPSQFGGFNGATGGRGAQVDPAAQAATAATTAWDRIVQGNIDVSADDTNWDGNPYIDGFHADYVEATQLVYTLSRPDVYNAILGIPFIGSLLNSQVGVEAPNGIDSYKYATVNEAITIGERMMWYKDIPDGYFWRSVDQFSFTNFVFYDHPIPLFRGEEEYSQTITTSNVDGEIQSDFTGEDTLQAQANELIWSLPNGLQAYSINGAADQLRVDAFTFVVIDPMRMEASAFGFGGQGEEKRLLNGASCMDCHSEGMNGILQNDMRAYIDENPGVYDAETLARVESLYFENDALREQLANDRDIFMSALGKIQSVMILGTEEKRLPIEPIGYMFRAAQQLYGYVPSVSN